MHSHKVYAEDTINHVSEAVSQLIRQVCRFIQIWEPEELKLLSESTGGDFKEDKKQKVLRHTRRATQVFCVSSVNRISISVESEWSTKYTEVEPGVIFECYNGKAAEEFGAAKLLSSDA